ncbi:outer membrane beta-barrel protein [Verrucomicrobiota bacterium sgz303538]
MLVNSSLVLTGRIVALGQTPDVEATPVSGVGVHVDPLPAGASSGFSLPVASGTSFDVTPPKVSNDDSIFLNPLFEPEGEPGFSLGDTSLPEPMLEDAEEAAMRRRPVVPIPLDDARRFRGGTPEALPEDVEQRVLLNAAVVAPRTITQRTALHQALSTSEAILGNLSGVRGALYSPFLPSRRPDPLPAFRIGVIDFRPHASVGAVVSHSSDDSESGNDVEAGAFFQAGILAVLRERGRISGALDYTIGTTPSSGGSSTTQDNAIDQVLSLSTDFTFPQMSKVHFGLGLDFASLASVDRDVGGVIKRTHITPSFTASYIYSRKTSFDWDITVPIRDFSDGTSSIGVTNTIFINNQITNKTQLGLGVAVGMLTVNASSDGRLESDDTSEGSVTQWFQQLLLRARYKPSALFAFDGTVGLEVREVGDTTDASPVFGLGVTWKPRPETTISLVAERRTFNSGTALNTNFTSNTISLRASQPIAYRLTASILLGYEHATYETDGERKQVQKRNQVERVDDLLSVSGELTLAITRRWSCTLTISAGKNFSNVQPFDYVQGVLQTSYEF